jgi:hypothetical protein
MIGGDTVVPDEYTGFSGCGLRRADFRHADREAFLNASMASASCL